MQIDRIRQTLLELAQKYPPEMREHQLNDIDRMAFNIDIATQGLPESATICDIGGGIGLFSLGCAALGYKAILVDDFLDSNNLGKVEKALELHKAEKVEIIQCDAVHDELPLEADSVDCVTTFDSMEHWHHSPKKLFHRLREIVPGGGRLVIGVPNCVNLRKRITVPLGIGSWSRMEDWYEEEVFRGHVREPSVADLKYIARDLGIEDYTIYGRNWLGYKSASGATRMATRIIDPVLKFRPTLCSDIYLVGTMKG